MAAGPVQIVFGTRPEAVKLAPLILEFRRRGAAASVVATGPHRDMLDQVLDIFGITPDHDLDVMTPDQSLELLTMRLLDRLAKVFRATQPAAVIVQGDTTTAMTAALAAHYQKIPVGHVEAGLRSGNNLEPWPEEANRRIISVLADHHFAPTPLSAEALRRENIPAAAIHVTGNTVIDALLDMRRRLAEGLAAAPEADAAAAWAAGRRMLLVTCHRRENFGAPIEQIAEALAELAGRSDTAIVLPVHPNPNVAPVLKRRLEGLASVRLLEPVSYPDMVRLLDRCHMVLTDSGGLQEEAPAFGKPVLVMRNTTERPEGVEAGTAMLVGAERKAIVASATTLLDDAPAYMRMARAHNPFGDGAAARRIADIVTGRPC